MTIPTKGPVCPLPSVPVAWQRWVLSPRQPRGWGLSRCHRRAWSPRCPPPEPPAAPAGSSRDGAPGKPRQVTQICSSRHLSASCCQDRSRGSPVPLSKLNNAQRSPGRWLSKHSNRRHRECVTDAGTQWKWGLVKPVWLRADKLLLILIACKIHRGRGHPCTVGMEGRVSSWGWRQSPGLI